MKYICLLRGINVGGKNLIKMAELKTLFEELGFKSVKTYVQSGNVIFESELSKPEIKFLLESKLFERAANQVLVLILTAEEMLRVISEKPAGFGEDMEHYKYDAAFLIEPLQAEEAFAEFQKVVRLSVDSIWSGEKMIYLSFDKSKAGKSHLKNILASPIYPLLTIRNWNTSMKLGELIK